MNDDWQNNVFCLEDGIINPVADSLIASQNIYNQCLEDDSMVISACKICNVEKEICCKNMCNACYLKEHRKTESGRLAYERQLAKDRIYQEQHKEHRKKQQKEYYWANREKRLANSKKWRENHDKWWIKTCNIKMNGHGK